MKKGKKGERRLPAQTAAEQELLKTEIRIQKADMTADTVYDYRRLEQEDPQMLSCTIEEEKETLRIEFDTADMMPFEQLKGEDRIKKIEVLLQAADLEKLYTKFDFSMQPDNLYYDRLGRVKIKRRDVIAAGDNGREARFLKMYQALTGYIMEGSRPYNDYLSGGLSIIKKNEEFVSLMSPETMEEEKQVLTGLYENTRKKERETTLRVDRKRYRAAPSPSPRRGRG